MTERIVPGTPAPPGDITAILAAMQHQIEDLTADVEAHQGHLDEVVANPARGN